MLARLHLLGLFVALLPLAACGTETSPWSPPPPPPAAAENWDRDILNTDLAVDIASSTATATITLAGDGSLTASFEIGDLDIRSVTSDGTPLDHVDRGAQLDVGVPKTDGPVDVTIAYRFHAHDKSNGADDHGFTLVWPYFCGNLFPCKSTPVDGLTFGMSLTGVPDGKVAVYPKQIPSDAPSYMIAWAIDDYVETHLGTTAAGTEVSSWHRPSQTATIAKGTAHLRAAFDWLESHLGPYRFGPHVGPVALDWGPNAFGGMEHHPFWHVADNDLNDEDTFVHEAAHGWFGDGVRIGCWEDLTLSEGTVTYLSAHVLDSIAPSVGAEVWTYNEGVLASLGPKAKVWPKTCGKIDVIKDHLWNNAVYYRGAFFYRAVAQKIGADALDHALAAFYARFAGSSATMADMLDTIHQTTGYDPAACADQWLRSDTIPVVGPCP